MRRFAVLLFLALLMVLPSAPAFASPTVGSQRPAIKLVDGWDHELDLTTVKRPLLVVYAGKDTSSDNQALSNELATLEVTLHYRRAIVEIAIAEVAAYDYWPARGVVKTELQKHSNHGVVVYSDFTGQVGNALRVTAGKSNVIFYGSDGKVLFSYAGALPDTQRKVLMELIRAQLGGA